MSMNEPGGVCINNYDSTKWNKNDYSVYKCMCLLKGFVFFNITLLLAASDHRGFVFWLIDCFSKNMELKLFWSNI